MPYGFRTITDVILTNAQIWSPDSDWVAFDRRSDPAGAIFDSTTIERYFPDTGESEILYRSANGACVGVATVNPVDGRVVFIHGPEHPSADWSYSACHRQGVIVDPARPGVCVPLDARDLVPPFTIGALRGGSHVHTWDCSGSRLAAEPQIASNRSSSRLAAEPQIASNSSGSRLAAEPQITSNGSGEWISFTYEDHWLTHDPGPHEPNRRTIGLAIPGPVTVPRSHSRNHDGTYQSMIAVRTVPDPQPGSDEISRAFEDGWIPGRKAITFIGTVKAADGRNVNELFWLEFPTSFEIPVPGPATVMPRPPANFQPRRLTRFADEPDHTGLTTSPRHWPRTAPDGSRVACLTGGGQLIMVDFNGTVNETGLTFDSAFTWHPDAERIAAVCHGDVVMIDIDRRIVRTISRGPARPEACVVSPDGRRVAFVVDRKVVVSECG